MVPRNLVRVKYFQVSVQHKLSVMNCCWKNKKSLLQGQDMFYSTLLMLRSPVFFLLSHACCDPSSVHSTQVISNELSLVKIKNRCCKDKICFIHNCLCFVVFFTFVTSSSVHWNIGNLSTIIIVYTCGNRSTLVAAP